MADMAQSALISINKKFSQLFWFKLATVCLLLCAVCVLWLQQAVQITELQQQNNEQQHKAQRSILLTQMNQQLLILQQQQTLDLSIPVIVSPERWLAIHQQLLDGLSQWQRLNSRQSSSLNSLINQLDGERKTLTQIAEQYQLLQQNHPTALQHLTDAMQLLQQQLDLKQSQRRLLFRQVSGDRLIDSVTVTRAKALANTVNDIQWLQQLATTLRDIQRYAHQLNINSSSLMLAQLEQQLKEFNALTEKPPMMTPELQAAILQINDDWQSTNRLVAKWRGLIRLVESYQPALIQLAQWLHQQNQQLPSITQQKASPQVEVGQHISLSEQVILLVPQSLLQVVLPPPFFTPMQWQLLWLLVAGLAMLLLVLTSQREQRWLSRFYQALFKQFAVTEHDKLSATTDDLIFAEQHELTQSLAQRFALLQPLQHWVAQLQLQYQLLAQQHQLACWQTKPALTHLQQQYLHEILTDDSDESVHWQGWRYYFDSSEQQTLLKAARLAKQGEIVCTTVKTKTGIPVVVSMQYQQGDWFGAVANHENTAQLQQALKQTQHQLQRQQATMATQLSRVFTKWQQGLARADKRLQQSSLQTQWLNQQLLRNAAYRQIKQLLQHIAHQEQLISPSRIEFIEEVDLVQTLHGAVLNCQQQQSGRKNQLYYAVDTAVATKIQHHHGMLQQWFEQLFNTLLQQQQGVQLTILLQLRDKNAGQQVIEVSCELSAPLSSLSQHVCESLLTVSDADNKTAEQWLAYSAEQLHLSDFHLSLNEATTVLSYSMPCTVAGAPTTWQAITPTHPKQAVLISDNSTVSTLIQLQLLPLRLKINCYHSVKQFQQAMAQYSRIDLVIFHGEKFTEQWPLLQQALTSAPKFIPCLPLVNQWSTVLSHDLAYWCWLPVYPEQLLRMVVQLLKEPNQPAVLAKPQWQLLAGYQATLVNVLVAVKQPSEWQGLVTLLAQLGLQPYVVTDEQSASNLWYQGTVSVLITEFKLALNQPVISAKSPQEMGCFALTNDACGQGIKQQLAPIDETARLIAQLSPWLLKRVVETGALAVSAENTHKQPIAKVLNQELMDLSRFARHQGAAQLAGLMLPTYMDELQQIIQGLPPLSSEQKIIEIQRAVKLSRILAADKLTALLLRYQQLLEENKAPKAMQQCWQQITRMMKALIQYTETI
jgi:hypothetical protein